MTELTKCNCWLALSGVDRAGIHYNHASLSTRDVTVAIDMLRKMDLAQPVSLSNTLDGDSQASKSIGFFSFAEKHYSPEDLAELWGLPHTTVRDLFSLEQGVIVLGEDDTKRYRKADIILRIPSSVAERVHRRLQKS